MKFTPETAMYIRDAMKYGGALLVAVGAFTAKQDAAVAGLTDLIVPFMEAVFGIGFAIFATVWAHLSKKATSAEAQVIAGRVEAHPTAQPIAPPGPLDEKVKDAHL